MINTMTSAEANRRFYIDLALEYDATEHCLCNRRQQRRFRLGIDRALSMAPGTLVLDACGGSGNAGVALAARGVVPVVVDVSPEMTAIWRSKAARLGLEPEIHIAPIEDFLEHDERLWDMISFCSALHHLEDPIAVLELAVRRLAPGGVIFTMFDPTRGPASVRLLRRLDWLIWLLLKNPRRFATLTFARVRRGSSEEGAEARVGRLAERHAYEGIDDLAVRARLEGLGLAVCLHDRDVETRLGLTRAVLGFLRAPSGFSLVVKLPR